jgi:hypothetical protein
MTAAPRDTNTTMREQSPKANGFSLIVALNVTTEASDPEFGFDADFSIGYTSRLLLRRLLSCGYEMGAS